MPSTSPSGSVPTEPTSIASSPVADAADIETPKAEVSKDSAATDRPRQRRKVADPTQRRTAAVDAGSPKLTAPSATTSYTPSSKALDTRASVTSAAASRSTTESATVRVAGTSPTVESRAVDSTVVESLTTKPATPSTVVADIISGVLSWAGLGPRASTSPTAPVDPPALLLLLAAARREIQKTFFGETVPNAKEQVDTSQPLALAAAPQALAAVAATPTFVQVNSAVPQTNQSSVTVKYNQAQTAGDTNILAIGWSNATSNITSVTDSAGNVYQVAVPTARGTGVSQAIYYAKNIKAAPAGGNTVTVTFNTATPYVDLRATEYSGLDATNPFDVGKSASGTTVAADSGNVTTTAPGLVFGAGTTAGAFKTAGTGFTTRVITNPDADIVADRTVSTAGAYNATATLSASSAWVMQVATFKAASTPVGDTVAPTVSITTPSGTASGTVTVTANASDNVGVSGVQFVVDGVALGAQDTTSPYSQTWNTTTAANGTHTLTAIATDTSGNTATSAPVTITVNNTTADTVAPTVTITDPPGGVVSGTFAIAANASDNVGVAGVRFLVDGNQIGAEDTTSPYGTTLNTIPLANGTHTLTAVARDAAGNTATSAPVTITVNNVDTSAPNVTLTAPTGTVSGTVTLTANATDNAGVAGVQFLVDGVALGAQDTTSPYSQTWNTSTVVNGTHTLAARATDVNGLTTTSAPVTVTVNNAASAPPAFKQVNTAVPQTNQSTVTVKYAGAQTAGDTNIVAIGWNNATSNITSVTDSAGNTYQLAVPTARGAGLSQAIYYAKNIKAAAAGTNTLTVNFNTATPYVDIRATEYSGLDANSPFDIGASASGTGTTANSGNVTTTAPGLVFGAGMTSGGYTTPGTGFTTRVITNPDADIALDRIVTSSGAYNATANMSGSSSWVMQVATFKAASVAPGDTVAPTVSVAAPAGTLTGTVTVTANASDNVGVAGVRFLVDNNQIGTEDTTSPYSQTPQHRHPVQWHPHADCDRPRPRRKYRHVDAGHDHRQQREPPVNSKTKCW